MKYKLFVDYGKPFEVELNTDEELKAELIKYKVMALSGDYPYLDVLVYNELGEDITEQQFINEMINEDEG